MAFKNQLINGFSKRESKKIELHLKKLLPYLDSRNFVIVGGLAIRYYVAKAGLQYPSRPFNDLDIIAKDINILSPEVKKDFIISHYHPKKNTSFYIVLIDPISKTKIDIFDYNFPPEETISVKFGSYLLKIQSIEDQLVKTVFDLQRISPEKLVDPKQFFDARLLMKIADMKKADIFWKKKKFKDYPNPIVEAFQRAEKISQEQPKLLKEKPFRKQASYECPDCVSTPDFPITPMDKIYQLLGYVE